MTDRISAQKRRLVRQCKWFSTALNTPFHKLTAVLWMIIGLVVWPVVAEPTVISAAQATSHSAGTVKTWLTEEWQLAEDSSEAKYYLAGPATEQDGLWHLSVFYVETAQPYFTGTIAGPELLHNPIVGDFEYFHENGQLMQRGTNNAKGQHHGPLQLYWQSGTLRGEYQYQNGQLEGEQKTYHQNGQLHRHEQRKSGKPFGLAESYHPNGALALRRHYDEQGMQGLFESFHDNGQPEQRVMMKNDKREGERLYWSKDGTPVYQQQYLAGKLHGEERAYQAGGVLRSVKQYQHGKQVGKQLTFNNAGVVTLEQHYDKQGRETQRIRYNAAGNKTEQHDTTYQQKGNLTVEQNFNAEGQLTAKFERDRSRNWQLRQRFDEKGELIGREERQGNQYQGLYLGRSWGNALKRANYLDGELHGSYSEETADNSEFIRGQYQHGVKVGKWVTKTPYSTVTENFNPKGEKDGVETEVTAEGIPLLQSFYRDGKLHGDYEKRDHTGQLQARGRYVSGVRHGDWQEQEAYIYGSVKLWHGRYQHGAMVGFWQAFSAAGHLLASVQYDDKGRKQGKLYQFNEDGSLVSVEDFLDDQLQGEPRYYYNGKSRADLFAEQ